MNTDMSATLSDEQKERIFRNLKNLLDRSVSSAVLFLLSESGEGITGQIMHVDNGTI